MGHKQARRYYQDKRKYDYYSQLASHYEQNKLIDVQVENARKEREFTDRQNLKKYNQVMLERQFKFDQENRIYEEKNRIADQQIDYNRDAAGFAFESLERQVFERKQKVLFEGASAKLKHNVAIQKINQGSREIIQAHQGTNAKHAIASQENLVKKFNKMGESKARGQAGRSFDKEVDGWIAVHGREEAAKLSMITKANEQVATKLYGLDFTKGVELAKRNLTIKAQEATMDSINAAQKLGVAETMLKWEGANMKANASRGLEPELGPPPMYPEKMPELDVFRPKEPGLGDKDYRAELEEHYGVELGDMSKDWLTSSWAMGPKPKGDAAYAGASNSMVTGSSTMGGVGGITAAVGAGLMAISTTAGALGASGAAIGFGVGSVTLGALGPIGAAIAAVSFLGSIFNWW